jgi:hypothetical protein
MFLTSLNHGVCTAISACTLAFSASTILTWSVSLYGHLPPIPVSSLRLGQVLAEQIPS